VVSPPHFGSCQSVLFLWCVYLELYHDLPKALLNQRYWHASLQSSQLLSPEYWCSLLQTLEDLSYTYAYEKLPCPTIFPGLTSLEVNEFDWNARWLGQLSCLPRLQVLTLSCSRARGPLLQLPALPALTCLSVSFRLDHSSATLRVVLWPNFPALQRLGVAAARR